MRDEVQTENAYKEKYNDISMQKFCIKEEKLSAEVNDLKEQFETVFNIKSQT